MLPLGFCLATFGVRYTQICEAARCLDELGFDSVWLWDHYVSWNNPRERVLECWTVLAGLTEITKHIHLGPLVANNLNRHPGRLAKVAATLQEMTKGRLELGLGGGGLAFEQEQFGIDQGDVVERTARVAEALQIIPALWSGEPVTFQGQYYRLTDAIVSPAPVPRPPIIVGARSPRMVYLAGGYADGVNLQWRDRTRLAEQLTALDEGLGARGRTREGFDLSVHAGWHELMSDPVGMLTHWQTLGFTRAIIYVDGPFPLLEFERLAPLIL